MPLSPPDGWSFDLAALERCVEQDAAWKTSHRFPLEVVRIVRPSLARENGVDPAVALAEDWRAVPLLRAEQALLVLVETAKDGEVLGFPVRADGWVLGREIVLTLPGSAVLAPLLGNIDAEAWKQAWQVWCHQRNLPSGEVEACKLEPVGHRLMVAAPSRLVERLRTARSDALKGEAWLLAGAGPVRATAQVDLGE
jgi:hypothetical protein